jgi:hypothetical protein
MKTLATIPAANPTQGPLAKVNINPARIDAAEMNNR